MYGLVERTVRGDGNCQFRALADQLYRSEDMHADVRRTVVHQLRACSEVGVSVSYLNKVVVADCHLWQVPSAT